MSFASHAERRLLAQLRTLDGLAAAQDAVLELARESNGVEEAELWPADALGSWRAQTAASTTMDLTPTEEDAGERMLVVPLWAGDEQLGTLAVRTRKGDTAKVAADLERFVRSASRLLEQVRDRAELNQVDHGPSVIPVEAIVIEFSGGDSSEVTALSRGALRLFGHDRRAWAASGFFASLVAPAARSRLEQAVAAASPEPQTVRIRAVDAQAHAVDLDVEIFHSGGVCQLVLHKTQATRGSKAIAALVSSLNKACVEVQREPLEAAERLALLELSEQVKNEADRLSEALRPSRRRSRAGNQGIKRILSGVLPSGVRLDATVEASAEEIAAAPAVLTPVLVDLAVQAGLAAAIGGTVKVHVRTIELSEADAIQRGVAAGPHLNVRVASSSLDPSIKPTRLRPQSELLIKNAGNWRFLSPSNVEFDLPLPASQPDMAKYRGDVMLVVPDPAVLRNLVRLVTHLGFRPHAAVGPAEALSFSERCDRPIDMVLVDLELTSARAWDLAERLEALHPGAKTVFLAQRGRTLPPEAGRGVAVLARPFTARELSATFAALLPEPNQVLAAAG